MQDYYEDLSGFIRGYGRLFGMSPGSNLTGLICTDADWIVSIHKELGTQDFRGDLSGFIRGYGRLSRYATEFKPDRSYLCLCWLNCLNTYRTWNARLLRYTISSKPDRSHLHLCYPNSKRGYETRYVSLFRRPVRFHKRVRETFAVRHRIQTWQVLSVPMLIESFQYIKNSERKIFTVYHLIQTWQVSFTSVLSE